LLNDKKQENEVTGSELNFVFYLYTKPETVHHISIYVVASKQDSGDLASKKHATWMQALDAWILFMTGFLIDLGLILIRGYSVAVLSRASK